MRARLFESIAPESDLPAALAAQAGMQRGALTEDVIGEVLRAPEQRLPVRPGREVLQSRIVIAGKEYLVRIFVGVDRQPAEVVTMYRTSKIAKYWRHE